MGSDPGWPWLGMDHGLVQPRRTDHHIGRDQRRHVPLRTGALFPHTAANFDLVAQAFGVVLITFSQAAINHLGIGVTARLTDFSGYWILGVATAITGCLLVFAPTLDLTRLITFENFSGTLGGSVWPRTEQFALLFALGALLPAYTITGFDASAHAAEETKSAARSVPLGIVRSVLVSGIAGWIMLCAWLLPHQALQKPQQQGKGRFCRS